MCLPQLALFKDLFLASSLLELIRKKYQIICSSPEELVNKNVVVHLVCEGYILFCNYNSKKLQISSQTTGVQILLLLLVGSVNMVKVYQPLCASFSHLETGYNNGNYISGLL